MKTAGKTMKNNEKARNPKKMQKKMPTSPRPYTIVSPFCCVMVML
jgi:hypothetical protein